MRASPLREMEKVPPGPEQSPKFREGSGKEWMGQAHCRAGLLAHLSEGKSAEAGG